MDETASPKYLRNQANPTPQSVKPECVRLPMKIFQIGFHRCGTRTIHRYLQANGVRSVHFDDGRLAKRMFTNLANGDRLLTGYEDFDAFNDMEFSDRSGVFLEGYKLFPVLAEQYPDAVFILNTRDREAWIRSQMRHGLQPGRDSYALRHMAIYNVTSVDELIDIWRADWERHHSRVTEFFSNKSFRFFVCRIEADLPQLLNEKLPECRLDSRYYPRPKKKWHDSQQAILTRLRSRAENRNLASKASFANRIYAAVALAFKRMEGLIRSRPHKKGGAA